MLATIPIISSYLYKCKRIILKINECLTSEIVCRCQRGCLPGRRRKRRAVIGDGTEHVESTTKNIVSRGPLIFKDEVMQGGNLWPPIMRNKRMTNLMKLCCKIEMSGFHSHQGGN